MNILFKAVHFGYEEGYNICIYEQNGIIYIHTVGNSVLFGDFDTEEEISTEEALRIMLKESENEDDGYLNMM